MDGPKAVKMAEGFEEQTFANTNSKASQRKPRAVIPNHAGFPVIAVIID